MHGEALGRGGRRARAAHGQAGGDVQPGHDLDGAGRDRRHAADRRLRPALRASGARGRRGGAMTRSTPAFREITTGLRFPEGPVAMPDGSVVLVEIERQTLSRVTPDGKIHVIARLGGGPNGAAMGPGGKIYATNNGGLQFVERPAKLFRAAQADDYTTASIQVVDPESGKFDTLYHARDAPRPRGPNDLVFAGPGGFWF